jgi:LTXXQ motif family protein
VGGTRIPLFFVGDDHQMQVNAYGSDVSVVEGGPVRHPDPKHERPIPSGISYATADGSRAEFKISDRLVKSVNELWDQSFFIKTAAAIMANKPCAKAIEMLQSTCPQDLPSIPTGRLAAMENRLQVMLVQTVRPALERFYRSLSDEQKARFNAIAPANDANAAGKDQRDLAKFCDEKSLGATDLPIDRIAQVVQPTPAQRPTLDELNDASTKAAEQLNTECPDYQTLTPTGRVEAMEKRLDAALGAVKTVRPALTKFYNSLSDEQKAPPLRPRRQGNRMKRQGPF